MLAHIKTVLSQLFADSSGTEDDFDREYLKRKLPNFRWLSVKSEDEKVRCNLCGRQMPILDIEEMFQHISEHGELGGEINPYETTVRTYKLTKDMIE